MKINQALMQLVDAIRSTVIEEMTGTLLQNGKTAVSSFEKAPRKKARKTRKAKAHKTRKAKPVTRSKPRSKAVDNEEVLVSLVEYVKANPGLNGSKIAEGLGIERKLVTGRLKRAREQGLLKVKGHTRGAAWWAK